MNKSLLQNKLHIQFHPRLAAMIGVNEAIVLQAMVFALSLHNSGKDVDGFHWIWNTYKEWQENWFCFWSVSTIERTIKNLEKHGLVVGKQLDGPKSRVRSYRIPDSSFLLLSENRYDDLRKSLEEMRDHDVNLTASHGINLTSYHPVNLTDSSTESTRNIEYSDINTAGGLTTPARERLKKPKENPAVKITNIERIELLHTLAEIDGQNPLSVTQSNWSRYAKVLKEIKAVSPAVARPELLRRAANYRTKWPDRQLTATALGKWWGALDSGRPDGPPVRTSVKLGASVGNIMPREKSEQLDRISDELNFEQPDFS